MGSRGVSSKTSKSYKEFLHVNSIEVKNKTLTLKTYSQAKDMVNWLENEAIKAGQSQTIKFDLQGNNGSITSYGKDSFGLHKNVNSFTTVGLGNWSISKREALKYLKNFNKDVNSKNLAIIN
jgi:hypothetical protein